MGLAGGGFWSFLRGPQCVSGDCEDGCGVRLQPGVFRYEGCFQNGRAHGQGAFELLATGESYSGQWRHGNKHGRGIYVYTNGTEYEGEWEDNQRQGQGTLRSSETGAVIYSGLWQADERRP